VMFFSLSSEIVIVTYGDLLLKAGWVVREAPEGAARLGGAPLGFGSSLRILNHVVAIRSGNTIQNFISCVLNARARAMELASRF